MEEAAHRGREETIESIVEGGRRLLRIEAACGGREEAAR
jgi:hypothetical protein